MPRSDRPAGTTATTMPSRMRSTARSQHVTSIEAIEKAALELIAVRGFDETPVEQIAAAAGISRRTFFRYFPSKNDIPFGDYGALLESLESWLTSQPTDRPILDVIADAVMRFNRVHSDGEVAHRERMKLILHTPSLRANAALRQDEWVAVFTRYAAKRLGTTPDSLSARVVAHISLGASSAAYERWLDDDDADLADLVRRAFAVIGDLSSLTVNR
jgi:TetR/AcrR family transcriptional regulator, regulator of mycofactocin system